MRRKPVIAAVVLAVAAFAVCLVLFRALGSRCPSGAGTTTAGSGPLVRVEAEVWRPQAHLGAAQEASTVSAPGWCSGRESVLLSAREIPAAGRATTKLVRTTAFAEHKVSITHTYPVRAVAAARTSDGQARFLPADGMQLSREPGRPELPVAPVRLLLPPGEEVEEVVVVSSGRTVLPGSYAVALVGEPVVLPSGKDPADAQGADPDAAYPGSLATVVGVQGKKGHSILFMNLHPVEYRQKSGRLACHRGLAVHVKTRKSVGPVALKARAGAAGEVRRLVDNPEMLAAYRAVPAGDPAPLGSLVDPADSYPYVAVVSKALRGGYSLAISPGGTLRVPEGGSASFSVWLTGAPPEDVSVSFARLGDMDLTITGGATMTFTPTNWATPQQVTITAAEDADAIDGSAAIRTTGTWGLGAVDIVAKEIDNDVQRFITSPTSIVVPENGSASFTVCLAAPPAGDVNAAVTTSFGELSFLEGESLTFTTGNWNVPQTVTVALADDADAVNFPATTSPATIRVSATGLASADVYCSEEDDDADALCVSPYAGLRVPEGGSVQIGCRLSRAPAADVAVDVSLASGADSSFSLSGTSLLFTPANWSTPQNVTVSAAEDPDCEAGTATVTFQSYAYGIRTAGVIEADNEPYQAVVVSGTALQVREGDAASLGVRLASTPAADVTVSIVGSGDGDISVSASTLTFTPANWADFQTVTVSAADDADTADGLATIALTADGATGADVTVRELDDDGFATGCSVDDLVALRASQGLAGTVVILEDVLANYSGRDDAEKLRSFAIDAYNGWETEYVLLVGDANAMPYRGMFTGAAPTPDIFVPSDLYFSTLEGTLDYDGDSWFGETTDGEGGTMPDILADVWVGRIAAEDTREASNQIYKIMVYEALPELDPYRYRAIMAGERLGILAWGDTCMEQLIAGSSSGFTTAGLDPYVTPYRLYDGDGDDGPGAWDGALLMGLLNSDSYGAVHHQGLSALRMSNADADALANTKPFFVYSQTSDLGKFSGDCFAEHLTTSTRHGAAAAVLNSSVGTYPGGLKTSGACHYLHRHFIDAAFGERKAGLGQALADAKEELASSMSDQYLRHAIYESNLFGDPAMRLPGVTELPMVMVESATPADPTGNGDGIVNPGEAIDLTVVLKNAGQSAAGSVTAVLSSSSPHVTITASSASFGDLAAAGGTAAGSPVYSFAVSGECPTGTELPFTLAVADGAGHAWTRTITLRCTSSSTIAGRVSDLDTGAGIAGATVSYSGPASGSVTTLADGTYITPPLPDGSYTLTASQTGYQPKVSSVQVLPPSATGVDFALAFPNIVLPELLSARCAPGSGTAKPLPVQNTGCASLDFGIVESSGTEGTKLATCAALPSGYQGVSGVDWGGDGLWRLYYKTSTYTYEIRKQDVNTGATIATVPMPPIQYPQGLAWDGTCLWVGSPVALKLYRVNPATGAIVASGEIGAAAYIDMAWDGSSLWVLQAQRLIRYDTDGSVLSSFNLPSSPTSYAVAWDGVALWTFSHTSPPTATAWDRSGNKLTEFACSSSCGLTDTVAWDGQHFWSNCYTPIRIDSGRIPWLSASARSGTVAGKGCSDLTMTFDAAALTAGTYAATLKVASNDIETPMVNVPVTLVVNSAPVIDSYSPGTPFTMFVGDTQRFEVWATDANEDDLSYLWKLDDAEVGTNASSYDYGPAVAGPHTIEVSVSDGQGGVTAHTWDVIVKARPGDFDGDGKADILWRHTTTYQTAVWTMDGATRVSGAITSAAAGAEWAIAGLGDFNGDGKADILWRHTGTHQTAVWFMNGATRTSSAYTSVSAGAEWAIAAVADFNGDGKADILWRHTGTQQTAVWTMDGATRTSGALTSAAAGAEWAIGGLGDFNGDGKSDILWRHTGTHQTAVWFMNGATRTSSAYTSVSAGAEWAIAAVADFGGDGKADILWRHVTTYQTAVWTMDGAVRTAGALTSAAANSAWTVQQLADFDGDGKADILWREAATGKTAIWFMNGATRTSSAYTSVSAGNEWQIQ